ncbi:hypothetical protein NCC49_001867 [Naganishia albida]|nr:hypothetical protein NCC49_001867 [Naganishia albida]
MTESAKSSMPGTNFWAEVLEMEDDTRQEEEKTAKENSWTFPPRDREMARRVIDKFFHGINHFRPIINEEEFKREYGRLSRGTVTDSEEFQPEFIACAHMVLALGTTIMDLEAQQTKSALTEVPVRGPPIPFAPDWTHSGGQQEQALATTIHSAAAMSDSPVPANNFQFPLGHSTLFDKNDIEENIDGIGKDDYTWPAATYFFRQGMRVVRKGTDTSMQDLQKMIMIFEMGRLKNEILTTLFDSSQGTSEVLRISREMAGRLDSFSEALPSEIRKLHEIWTASENVTGKGRDTQTSSQGKFSLELIIDTAHILLEYTITYDLCLRAIFMNMNVNEEERDRAMRRAMQVSRTCLIAYIHLSHFATTYVLTYPCSIFVSALILLNGASRGFAAVPREEVRVITEKAVQLLKDSRWSSPLRPIQETANTLQQFHEEVFGTPGAVDSQQASGS